MYTPGGLQMVNDEIFQREANSLARGFAPEAYKCKKCGHAVLRGYCCTFCGTMDPETRRQTLREKRREAKERRI